VHHTFTAHGKEKLLIREKVLQSNTLTTESLLELMICTVPLDTNTSPDKASIISKQTFCIRIERHSRMIATNEENKTSQVVHEQHTNQAT
jgi:hypothetical protein